MPLVVCAALITASFGGIGPGLLAWLLSFVAIGFSSTPTLPFDAEHLPALLLVSAATLLTGWVGTTRRRAVLSLRRARDELRARVEELRAANAALQAEVAKDEGLLRESEMRLTALAGSTDEIVFEFDGNGTYLNVWTRNEALLFRPRPELIGRTLAEVFDEGWARHHVERLRRVLASGAPEIWQYRVDLPSGRSWFLGRMAPMPSVDGARRTVACLVRDITQQKRDEASRGVQHGVARALADSDSLAAAAPHVLAAIGESMEWDWGAFWTVDRERGRLWCEALWHAPSLAVAEVDELSQEIALTTGEGGPGRVCETAQPDWVARVPEDRGSFRRAVAARAGLQSGVAFPIFDLHPPRSSDADRPAGVAPAFAPGTGTVEITGRRAWHPVSGEVLGVIEFFSRDLRERDEEQLAMLSVISGQIGQVLERKRAEAELRRREQELRARQDMLELAQRAARAVAFEWYIGARESENRWSPDLEAMYGLGPGTFDRTYRGWRELARIRAFARRQAPRMELLHVNRKVLEVVALTEHEVRSHDIVLQTQLDRTLPPVLGDRVQLQQVLLNLILNAIEAMSGVHNRPRELTIVSAQEGPKAAVTVEVRDSGPGLEPERVERVFEPFYTTKAEGVGIGLSISRSIVEAHGGRLWASANEPRGAVFRFSLPVSSATTRLA